jgi:hypothetical protein
MRIIRTRRQSARAGLGNGVLLIGESRQLIEVCDWAQRLGLVPVDIPHVGLLCAVADTDVLNGFCTPFEANLLHRVRALGLPCLTPTRATAYLASVVSGRAATRV